MKNKKLFTFFSLALLGTLISACSCGGDNSTSPTNTTPNSGSVVTPSTTRPITNDIWTVTFDYNYENKFKTYMTDEVKDGDKVEKPIDPIRQGYDFVAWYDDPYCRSQYLWDFETPVRQSMTLYANWELNGEEITDTDYVITYQSILGATYVPVDSANLIYTAEYGELIRFKVDVDTVNYSGTLKVTVNGQELTPDEDGIYSYQVTEDLTFELSGLEKISTAYQIFYENPNNWADVYIYMWDANSVDSLTGTASVLNASWPGERMSLDANTGYYYYDIESSADCTYTNVIFNNNAGGQTADLTLTIGYKSNATLYSGNASSPTASEFDPKSTTATIVWTQSNDYTFLPVNEGEELPTSANKGDTISFKVIIDKVDYNGNPKVMVNGEEIIAVDGIYSFEVTSLLVTIKVTNIMGAGLVELYYTLPTWEPVAYSPKIYYWGTDADGTTEIRNTVSWDSGAEAEADEGGKMTLVEGNEYVYTIDLKAGQIITGIIVMMYQDDNGAVANLKQSRNLSCEISSAGAYDIAFAEGWEQNEFGVWCFAATITPRG